MVDAATHRGKRGVPNPKPKFVDPGWPAAPAPKFTCSGCGERFTIFETSCGCPSDPFHGAPPRAK